MGPWVILAIVIFMIFAALLALGCCKVARESDEQDERFLSAENLKTTLVMQYLQLCQDYGVVPEWTDAQIWLFRDDYEIPKHTRPVLFNGDVIGYMLEDGMLKINATELKQHYETNVMQPLQGVA